MAVWPRVQIRRVARFAYGNSLSVDDRVEGEVPVYGSNGQVGVHDRPNTSAPVIIVGRKGSYGKVNYSDVPVAAIDTTYFVDPTTTSQDLRWLYYALSVAELDTLGQDVGVPGLNREQAYGQRIPLPPLSTQRTIADYLDTETARIDALIEKKKQMIQLREERVGSIVSERLSEVDARVARLGHVARVYSGAGFPHEHQGRDVGDYPFFKVGDLAASADGRWIDSASNWIDKATAQLLGCQIAPAGTVLFPKVGAALLGNQRRIARVSAVFDNNLMAVTSTKLEPRYLRYSLTQIDLGMWANPGPVPSVNEGTVASLHVKLPAFSEQVHVADELDSVIDYHHQFIELAKREIDLLSERRNALITASVTGQLLPPGAESGVV